MVIGLGSMVGAGVFTAIGPAAAVAGGWLLVALAVANGVALVAINYTGIGRTATTTRVRLAVTLTCLPVAVVALLGGCNASPMSGMGTGSAAGAPEAAAFTFLAFAGYARITTLGEEVPNPARTTPRGIPLALSLAWIHPRFRTPFRTEVAVGLLVAGAVALGDPRGVIGFSPFAVLGYCAIANASALTLPRDHARRARVLPAVGTAGCAALALALPLQTAAQRNVVLAAGALVFAVRSQARLWPRLRASGGHALCLQPRPHGCIGVRRLMRRWHPRLSLPVHGHP